MTLSVERQFVDGAWRTVVTQEGGSQPHLIGPFTVNFDDPGIDTTGVEIGSFAADTVILMAYFLAPTAWTTSGGDNVSVDFYIGVKWSGSLVGYATSWEHGNAFSAETEPILVAAGVKKTRVFKPTAAGVLTFEAYAVTGSLDAGVADIYALVYSP